jgi:hypothetical protein
MVGFDGAKCLVKVNGRINAEKYIEILKNNLLDIEDLENRIFMQDGAPCLSTTKTRKFFLDNDIDVLEGIHLA